MVEEHSLGLNDFSVYQIYLAACLQCKPGSTANLVTAKLNKFLMKSENIFKPWLTSANYNFYELMLFTCLQRFGSLAPNYMRT